MTRFTRSAVALAAAIALGPCASLAAQRVFVKSNGNDANTAAGCSFINPCRSFTAALTQVDPGGEVVALDAAGYGAVTIDKSVTLTANPGYHAGIAASSGAAVTIATPGVDVVLRGLQINGVGANNGVAMTNGESLTVENCVFSNFLVAGINVNAAARVRVVDSTSRGNGTVGEETGFGIYLRGGVQGTISNVRLTRNVGVGLLVEDGGGATTQVTMSDSTSSNNSAGAIAQTTGTGIALLSITRSTFSANVAGLGAIQSPGGFAAVIVGSSAITTNGVGVGNIGGTVATMGDNFIRLNDSNIIGTLQALGGT